MKKLNLSNMYDIHEKPSGFCNIKAGCLFAAWSSEWQPMSSLLLWISAWCYFRSWLFNPLLPSSKWFLVFLSTVTQKLSFKTLYFLLLSHSSSEGTPATPDFSFTLKWKSLRRGNTKPVARIYIQPGQESPWAAHLRATTHKNHICAGWEEQGSVHRSSSSVLDWEEWKKAGNIRFLMWLWSSLLTKDYLNTSGISLSTTPRQEEKSMLLIQSSRLTLEAADHYTQDQGSDGI